MTTPKDFRRPRPRLEQAPPNLVRCPICGGNDWDIPCANPTERLPDCPRTKRLSTRPETSPPPSPKLP
jgi:hypothetical protein